MARARKNLLKIYTGLNDRPLHEQEESDIETYNSPSGELHKVDHSKKEEKVEIEIPGVEGKQEVKIKYKDTDTDEALKGVTITFGYEGDDVEKYTDVDFEYSDDTGNDHENEGKDVIFAAEGDGMMFEVEVQVESGYENSGRIQYIDWETLTITIDDEGEPLDEKKDPPGHWDWKAKWKRFLSQINLEEAGSCTEQEIEEGTCGEEKDLFFLHEELEERKNISRWTSHECEDDNDCADEGLCCDNGECAQCISFEKPNVDRHGDPDGMCRTDQSPSGCPEGQCCASLGSTSHLGYCTSCDQMPVKQRRFEGKKKNSKQLSESFIKRLQKLANIKK